MRNAVEGVEREPPPVENKLRHRAIANPPVHIQKTLRRSLNRTMDCEADWTTGRKNHHTAARWSLHDPANRASHAVAKGPPWLHSVELHGFFEPAMHGRFKQVLKTAILIRSRTRLLE